MLPLIGEKKAKKQMRTEFRGLCRREGAEENEFAAMANMSGRSYPLLRVREPRGRARGLVKFNGMLGGDRLCFVDGTEFFYEGYCYGTVEDSPKLMVRMGAQILIFPDKLAFNTQTYSFSPLENAVSAAGAVLQPLTAGGESFEAVESGETPDAPTDGMYWLDTRDGSLKQYSAAQESWAAVNSTRVQLGAAGIGEGFAVGDGVEISGTGVEGMDGVVILQSVEKDAVSFMGVLGGKKNISGTVRVARSVPDLVLAAELDNRVWGVCAGENEIRACKQGDPTNWQVYAGISTDSYAVSVGSDGAFTGIGSFGGYLLFFKENWLHKLYGTQPSNFQLTSTLARGVGSGAAGTLAQAGDVLYYAGTDGVYAYDGSLPMKISWDLGDGGLKGISAAEDGGCYVLCAESGAGCEVLVYDPTRGLWHREDGVRMAAMARGDGDVWMADTGNGILWSRHGTIDCNKDAYARPEDAVGWRAETAVQSMSVAGHKFVSRLLARVKPGTGAFVDILIRYDSAGEWMNMAHMEDTGLGTREVALLPRRCDHFALAFAGEGDATVFSICCELRGEET